MFGDTKVTFICTSAHCSYLDIYISPNIRLWKGDFEGKFQSNIQAKTINFIIWKCRFILLIFLLFFAEFVKSSAFYTLLLLFQRVDMFELWFLHQTWRHFLTHAKHFEGECMHYINLAVKRFARMKSLIISKRCMSADVSSFFSFLSKMHTVVMC